MDGPNMRATSENLLRCVAVALLTFGATNAVATDEGQTMLRLQHLEQFDVGGNLGKRVRHHIQEEGPIVGILLQLYVPATASDWSGASALTNGIQTLLRVIELQCKGVWQTWGQNDVYCPGGLMLEDFLLACFGHIAERDALTAAEDNNGRLDLIIPTCLGVGKVGYQDRALQALTALRVADAFGTPETWLYLTLGLLADALSGGTGTTISTATCDVSALIDDSLDYEVFDPQRSAARDFLASIGWTEPSKGALAYARHGMHPYVDFVPLDLPAAGKPTLDADAGPAAGHLIKTAIRAYTNTGDQSTESDAVFSKLGFRHNVRKEVIDRALTYRENQILANLHAQRKSTSGMPTGVVAFDWDSAHDLTGGLRCQGANSLKLQGTSTAQTAPFVGVQHLRLAKRPTK